MQADDKKILFQESVKYGALRELKAAMLFMDQEYTVSVPNMSARYDFIAERYPAVIRVKVKNLVLKKGDTGDSLSHKTWCIRPYTTTYGKRHPYNIEDCDIIVGISLDTGDFALVPISEVIGKATEYNLSMHKDSKGKEYLNSYKAIDDFYDLVTKSSPVVE